MPVIETHLEIAAPKEEVWRILADLGGVQSFHPLVKKSYYNPGKRSGVGASRHCDFKPFGQVEETAIEWNEGESITLRLHDGKGLPPFKKALGTFGVREATGGSVASVRFEYSMRYGPLGALMDVFMVKRQFMKGLRQMLAGLKSYAEDRALATA